MAKQQFVLELGRAMHALGSPAYRVEDTMAACCAAFGLTGSFFATPTAIFVAIGAPGEEPKTTLLRVFPGHHDLARLAELYAIRDDVVAARTPPHEGLVRVRDVLAGERAPPAWLAVLVQVLIGGGAALLLGGGEREALVAAGAGGIAGAIGVFARWHPVLDDVQAALTCAVVAFAVRCAAALWPIDVLRTTIAAIIVLLPGLAFTTALAELAMRHLAAGSARLLGTLAVFVTMAIGIGIGDRCAALLVGPLLQAPVPGTAPLGIGIGLLASWLGFVVLLHANVRQAPWVLFAMASGYGGARLGGAALGNELGPVLGALLVTLLANLHARWLRQPAAVVRTPGLLLLVPGSLGVSGLTTAISGAYGLSGESMLRMLLIGGAIVAGLLFGGVLLPPPLDVEPDSRPRSLLR